MQLLGAVELNEEKPDYVTLLLETTCDAELGSDQQQPEAVSCSPKGILCFLYLSLLPMCRFFPLIFTNPQADVASVFVLISLVRRDSLSAEA